MCELNSDELDNGLGYSGDEANGGGVGLPFFSKKKEKKKKKPARTFQQEIDTNVFKIGFKTICDKAEIATGDPIFCIKCNSCFNIHSHVEETKDMEGGVKQVWKCEFCNTEQIV